MSKTVSVIITTYRRTDFLIRAINSVLDSDYKNFEIIVIDDNGLNSSYQQLNAKNLVDFINLNNFKYFAMPLNLGACAARNKGGEIATGEILMFLDDDDYYFKNKISRQVSAFENNDIDACLCAMKRIDENNFEIISKQNFPRSENLKQFLIDGNCFTTMIAIKRKSFLKIKGFSKIGRFQDIFFMMKFHENNLKNYILNEQLFVLSEHKQERISLANINIISDAYDQIFEFKKKYFNLFDRIQKSNLENQFNLDQANIRSSGTISQRIMGLKFLIKSNLIFKNRKTFIKLLLSDQLVNIIKLKILTK